MASKRINYLYVIYEAKLGVAIEEIPNYLDLERLEKIKKECVNLENFKIVSNKKDYEYYSELMTKKVEHERGRGEE